MVARLESSRGVETVQREARLRAVAGFFAGSVFTRKLALGVLLLVKEFFAVTRKVTLRFGSSPEIVCCREKVFHTRPRAFTR